MIIAAFQTAPALDPATSASWELAKQGILGAFCLLFLIAIVWLAKLLLKTKDDRTSDAKEYAQSLRSVNDASSSLVVETNRMLDAMKAAVDRLQDEQRALIDNIARLKDEQVRLVASHSVKGGRL